MSELKIALITGITGQDGSYLAELLLEKNYCVWGLIRRGSNINTQRIEHIFKQLHLRYGDLSDGINLSNILNEIYNTYKDSVGVLEVYNLGAMSHVKVSFDMPEYTGNVDGLGTLRLLETLRNSSIPLEKIRFYQASTSEMFGKVQEVPQKESTSFYPRSPYGVAKLYGHWITKNYREAYGMYACSGILFNHESPRRAHNFVTRKITIGLNKILTGQDSKLVLGNIYSKRDWGHAKDYVCGMWLMLQQELPEDYILSTNEFHSVKEFVEKSFAMKGIIIQWKGEGLEEVGYDATTGQELIFVSDKYFRPTEVDELLGDSTKARNELGWTPEYSFDDLVKEMVIQDCGC
uniref:GDP-mannose 4,6-dehydratase n=1 Tax=viral metagenome TaxID=1070528 RepID=A0A6C0BXA2_9ZZZZ